MPFSLNQEMVKSDHAHKIIQHTFTPPNLGLPHTRSPLTPTINTLLAIRYSSMLFMYTNHLNTL